MFTARAGVGGVVSVRKRRLRAWKRDQLNDSVASQSNHRLGREGGSARCARKEEAIERGWVRVRARKKPFRAVRTTGQSPDRRWRVESRQTGVPSVPQRGQWVGWRARALEDILESRSPVGMEFIHIRK